MDPRKRLKTCENDSMEAKCSPKPECFTESSEIEDSSTGNLSESYLLTLPNEILIRICQYLSPMDLLSFSHVDQRISELTCYIKEANFSSSRRTSSQQIISYFTRLRVKHIKKLNFNYNIFLKPFVLEQLICRCKNLTGLSIVECGIKPNHLAKILQNCSKLEELSWNISHNADLAVNICCPKMKTLCLFCVTTYVSTKHMKEFLLNFPNVEYLFLNFASDTLSVFPFHGFWLKSRGDFLSSKKCVSITNCYQPIFNDSNKLSSSEHYFSSSESEEDDPRDAKGQFTTKVFSKNRVYDCPPYLQIRSTEEDISLLSSSGCYNVYSSLTILLTEKIVHLSESLVKNIETVAGYKLMHLSIQCEANPLFKTHLEAITICEIIKDISLCCQNITVLNIPTVHFSVYSPFKAITQLRNLRTLNIPSCCFQKSYPESEDCVFCGFHEVVSNCQKVENFTLIGCFEDLGRVFDADMYPLQRWKELKHLTIYNMIFRSCNFLKHVAASCEKLQSLSLISDSYYKGCLFTNDIIYVLKAAKNLSFIRINAPEFNPMYERFWDSVGEAINLEGICILTESKVHVVKQTVIKAIRKLKYLHLFHFSHPRAPANLYIEAKKSMQDHGINNIKLEKNCQVHVPRSLFYHQQPLTSCHHLHLENFS